MSEKQLYDISKDELDELWNTIAFKGCNTGEGLQARLKIREHEDALREKMDNLALLVQGWEILWREYSAAARNASGSEKAEYLDKYESYHRRFQELQQALRSDPHFIKQYECLVNEY